ncbi:hypothetical protein T484DRAFT_1628528, partial [Baffinella frigidus]
NPKPETRSPNPEARNPKLEARNPKHETRSPKPETRSPKPETRSPETQNPKSEPETDRRLARGELPGCQTTEELHALGEIVGCFVGADAPFGCETTCGPGKGAAFAFCAVNLNNPIRLENSRRF